MSQLMLEQLLRSVLPVLLMKVRAVPIVDKRAYAAFLESLAMAYIENRQADFALLLASSAFPESWQTLITEALWSEDQEERPRTHSGQNRIG